MIYHTTLGQAGISHCPSFPATDASHSILTSGEGGIDLRKGTYQNRARQVIILVRLDFGGAPHRNPDGSEVPSPHLHIYREGYGDKWAFEISSDEFPQVEDPWQALQDFMRFCNIVDPPYIQKGIE